MPFVYDGLEKGQKPDGGYELFAVFNGEGGGRLLLTSDAVLENQDIDWQMTCSAFLAAAGVGGNTFERVKGDLTQALTAAATDPRAWEDIKDTPEITDVNEFWRDLVEAIKRAPGLD